MIVGRLLSLSPRLDKSLWNKNESNKSKEIRKVKRILKFYDYLFLSINLYLTYRSCLTK